VVCNIHIAILNLFDFGIELFEDFRIVYSGASVSLPLSKTFSSPT